MSSRLLAVVSVQGADRVRFRDLDLDVEALDGPGRVDDGVADGVSSAEQEGLVELRRRTRLLEQENEILRRAAAYFAKDALPK